MALVKTAQYYLARFELMFSHRGMVDGATYTDVKAQLPALNLLMFISVAAAVLFIVNIRRRGWVLPDHRGRPLGVHLDRGRHDLPGGHPAVRRAAERVPAGAAVHRPQHRRRPATRSASTRIDREAVRLQGRTSTTKRRRPTNQDDARQRAALGPDAAAAELSSSTRAPALLHVLRRRPRPLRRRRTRQLADARVAVRELNSPQLPSQTWVNQHLVYTHGYGAVAAPRQRGQRRPDPTTCSHDIPPHGRRSQLDAAERVLRRGPQRLHGRRQQAGRATSRRRARTTTTRYNGNGGVQRRRASLRKAAFALRFGDLDLFISGQIDLALARHVPPRHPGARAEGGAVPAARRRPVRGRRSTASIDVGPRRLHDHEPVPVLAVAAPERCRAGQRSRQRRSTTCATR